MFRDELFDVHGHGADYVDAYTTALQSLGIDEIASHALQSGRELGRTGTEVVYEGGAPGLRFVVAYELDIAADELKFSTAVFYTSTVGRIYFGLVRPFHRRLAPKVPKVTVRRASKARR